MSSAAKTQKLDAALRYSAMNLSIIPVGPDKKPLLQSWKPCQEKRASNSEIKRWWSMWPEANPAVVTGAISGLVALDLDAKENRSSKEFKIPPTACAKSGNGGEHFYFRYPGFLVETKAAIFGAGVDIRGDGGYILLPPSVNTKGGSYEWTIPLEDIASLADIPDWLLEKVRLGDKKWLKGASGVGEGSRNDTAASMAGKLMQIDPLLWEEVAWPLFVEWNKKNSPPLDTKELRTVWDSIKFKNKNSSANSSSPKLSQADELVNLVKNNPSTLLFRSELDESFVQIPTKDHKEHWPCRSKPTKLWLAQQYWKLHHKAPNSDAIGSAINVLEGTALYDGERFELSNRVAMRNGSLFYFLANDKWEVARITTEGWEILQTPPIVFRKYTHQEAQVVSKNPGNLDHLFKYINIEREDHRLLLKVAFISNFIDGFPHPILYFHGPQGSAKTTASKVLRRLVDPSKFEVAEFPKDMRELVQQLNHHWFLIFDNVSHIPSELSDLLCRAVTGTGFSKRELYSDDSDIIYSFKRCIGMSSVSLPHLKPDLLERSILLQLERIPEERRQQEQNMMEQFEVERPDFLAAIFDTLSKALAIRKTLSHTHLPRMADFAMWGCAIAEALGHSQESFLKAYQDNIKLQDEEVISDNLEAAFLVEFMADKHEWVGSATELLKLIQDKYFEYRTVHLPKSASALSRRLDELKTSMAKFGIIIERIGGSERKLVIRRGGENPARTASLLEQSTLGDFNEYE